MELPTCARILLHRVMLPRDMRNWMKLLLLALVAIGATELYLQRVRHVSKLPGAAEAPSFALPDTSGRRVSLESLKGKVVAVNFWATWCGPCQDEIPDLVKVYSAHKNKCFEMLGIAEESGARDEVVAAAQKFGVNYPVLLDDDGKAGDAFRIPGYPRTFLIDVGGRIRKVFEGAVEREDLERELKPLLAEAPASCPRA
jgi:cytochrome c biogenesis protein CcmG, thiol:disulfide interchange protein DsbE